MHALECCLRHVRNVSNCSTNNCSLNKPRAVLMNDNSEPILVQVQNAQVVDTSCVHVPHIHSLCAVKNSN